MTTYAHVLGPADSAQARFVEKFRAEVRAQVEAGGSAITTQQADEALATVVARRLFKLVRTLENHIDRIEDLEYPDDR